MKKTLILLSISLLTITMITRNVTLAQNETTSEVVPTMTEEVAAVEEEKPAEIEVAQEAEAVIEQTEVPAEDEEGKDAELPPEEDSEKIFEEELLEEPEDDSEEGSVKDENETGGELSESELSESELSESELPEGELPEGENNETDLQESEQDSSNALLTGMVGVSNPSTKSASTSKELVIRADDVFVIDAENIWEKDGDVYVKKQERFSKTGMSPSIDIISDDKLKEKNRFYSYVGDGDDIVSYTYINLENRTEMEEEPSQPGSYEKIAKVTVKYEYLFVQISYELKTSVKFRIEGIKVVDIINDGTVTYTGNVVVPKLYAIDTGKNEITLEYGTDYYLTKTLFGGKVDSINASEEKYSAYAWFTQEFRNNHWSFDLNADKDLFVQKISYEIKKREVNVSYDKEFEYNKCYITPNIFVNDDNCNYQIVNVRKKDGTKDGTSITAGDPMNVGTYTAEIEFFDDFLNNNVPNGAVKELDNGKYQIEYKITKKSIKFDGWNTSVDPITTKDGKVFNWVGKDGDAKLVFNGYNPTLYNDAFPTANFVDLYDNLIDDKDLTFTVKPTSFLDGIGHHLVNIDLKNDNYRLIGKGGFTIVQKPVMIKWDNTVIDVKSHDKVPNARIVEIDNPNLSGVVASDEGKIFIDYDYYRIVNDHPVKVLIPPTEEGDYIVEAKIYYKGSIIPCLNYSYGDTYQTRYQIVDMKTSDDGVINTGTINKLTKDVTLDLLGFKDEQAEAFINNLPYEKEEEKKVKDALINALDPKNKKDINLYIVATDADASKLTLPDGVLEDEVICIDIQLFATVEGDTNKYQIKDTGAYPISIKFTITPEEAKTIGYNSNRLFYVARYHGEDTDPVVSQENPTVVDGNFLFVYESNKFSDFVIYTKDKPATPVARKTSHTVINTGD